MLNPSSSSRRSAAVRALLCIVCAALVCSAAFAQAQPLDFYKNYFVTGDYVVGGVGLRGLGVNGFAFGNITISAIPAGADVVAAFLYWQTVEKSKSAFAGQSGFFNSHGITGSILGNLNAPVSWSAGGCAGSSQGTTTLRTYRADVRPFLNDPAGINETNGVYNVQLADSGSNGGGTPLTLGATLVMIYRVLTPGTPMNAITIYDGSFAPSNAGNTMTLSLQGFYQAAPNPIAKLTEIVGNGQANKSEELFFDGTSLSTAPFPGALNGSWDNPTFANIGADVLPGDSVTTKVVPNASNSGCVSWGATIFSTTVLDSDHDGLLDIWKTGGGYTDVSNGEFVSLPNPHAPGANPQTQDLYVQIDWYASHDFITSKGKLGHSHVPKQAAIDMIGDAFAAHSITLHVDCGNCYPLDKYVIHSNTRGGSVIDESTVTCEDQPNHNPPLYCAFPDLASTGWKGGFESLKDVTDPNTGLTRFQHGRKDSYHEVLMGHALGLASGIWSITAGTLQSVVVAGGTATVTTTTPNNLANGSRIRVSGALSPIPVVGQDFALNGTYPSITVTSPTTFTFSLLTANVPAGTYNNPGLFISAGPALSTSGWSDYAGADSLITLGLWRSDVAADDQVGSALIQAGTIMHEIGHTLALQHGGADGVNCKSNFESVMNYLFQVRGLPGYDNNPHVDFSNQLLGDLSEGSLSEPAGIGAATYRTMWYAPLNALDLVINKVGGHAASRHCDGTPITDGAQMLRVTGPLTAIPSIPLDWNNDGSFDAVNPPGQDINFSGGIDAAPFHGSDDWMIIDLRQIGARRGAFGFSGDVWGTLDVGAGGTLEVGAGGTLDVGAGGTLDVGAGGTLDNGAGGTLDVGAGGQESNFDEANTTVDPPGSLAFTTTRKAVVLNWSAPGFGQIRTYFIWRAVVVPGVPVSPNSFVNIGSVSSANGPALKTFTDSTVKHNTTYMYFVTAALASSGNGVPGNQSGASNFVTVPF